MNLKYEIFFLLVALYSVAAKTDRIQLKDVQTLTLYSDKWTTARRGAPVKQLACVSGSCSRVSIETAQCYNRGFDGNDVQWECKAELPSNYKFGRLEVSCEGYAYPDDDYILAGSCGLEYSITEASANSNSYFPSYSNGQTNAKDGGSGSTMLTIVVVVAAAIALYFYLRPKNTQENTQNTTRGGSWFNSNPSAPPPPGFRPDYSGTNADSSSKSSDGTSNGPGFFSGMGVGSLLGYMFGSRGNNGYAGRNYRGSSAWNAPSSYGYSSFGSLRTGGGGSTRTSTSSGFASTRRR